jgi:hypothetical protein
LIWAVSPLVAEPHEPPKRSTVFVVATAAAMRVESVLPTPVQVVDTLPLALCASQVEPFDTSIPKSEVNAIVPAGAPEGSFRLEIGPPNTP